MQTARTGLPVAGQIALAAGFCLLLGLPALFPADQTGSEKRASAQRPAFAWRGMRSFPKNYERYFNDHFGLRGMFVRTHNVLKARVLGVSPLTKVVVGRDGWLYYDGAAARDGYSFSDTHNRTGYTPEALDGIAAKVKAQSDWLRDRGIHYAVIVSPNKESIYPEHLPASSGRRRGLSRLDQVAASLSARQLPIVDPRAALLRAKARGPLYYRADTHWNSLGGLVAYRELIERLRGAAPALAPVRWEDFTVRIPPAAVRDGDLAVMLSLEGLMDDHEVTVEPRNASDPRGRLGKVLLFHDSFGTGFSDLLRLHFAEVIRQEGAIDFRVIEEQRPDVVIFEMAERYLDRLLKSEMPPPPAEREHTVYSAGVNRRRGEQEKAPRRFGRSQRP